MKKFLLLLSITLWGFSGQLCKAGDEFDEMAALEASMAEEEAHAVEESVNTLLAQSNQLKDLFAKQAQSTFVSLIKRQILLKVSTTCPTHLMYIAQFINYNSGIAGKLMLVLRDVLFDIVKPLQKKNQILKNNFDRITSGFAMFEHFVNLNLNNITLSLPMGFSVGSLDDSRYPRTSGRDVITRMLKEGNEIVKVIEGYPLPHFKPLIAPLKTLVGFLRMVPLSDDIIKKVAISFEKHFTSKQRASIIEFFDSVAFQILKKNSNIFLDLPCFRGRTQPAFLTQLLELLANIFDSCMQLAVKAALV
jgi:hypothetical protein